MNTQNKKKLAHKKWRRWNKRIGHWKSKWQPNVNSWSLQNHCGNWIESECSCVGNFAAWNMSFACQNERTTTTTTKLSIERKSNEKLCPGAHWHCAVCVVLISFRVNRKNRSDRANETQFNSFRFMKCAECGLSPSERTTENFLFRIKIDPSVCIWFIDWLIYWDHDDFAHNLSHWH